MEDFKLLVSVRFPELKKFIQWALLRLKNYEAENYNDLENMESEMYLFEMMLRNSIRCVQKTPISAFTEMYFLTIRKYLKDKEISANMILQESFVLLFETLVKLGKFTPEYCITFLNDLQYASNGDIASFISFLPENNVKLILDCLVKQRFHAWDVIGVNWLADWLQDEECHHFCEKLFIRYGFHYTFLCYYFEGLIDVFMEGMRVDNVPVYFFLDPRKLFETEDILRMQLAIELLVALFIKEENRNAISLLWKALPYAFITANELYNLLNPCIIGRTDDLLKRLCDEYEKTVNTICPVPKVPEPRSLKHLSRVQVRNTLFEVHNLNEETIGELDIPVTLKDYLWLNDCKET